jgi:hypothetical protein
MMHCCSRLWLSAAILAAGILVVVGFLPVPAARVNYQVTQLRQVFQNPTAESNPKSQWFARERALLEALSHDVGLCDAAASYLAGEPQDDRENFVGTLQCALLHTLVARNDDERLRQLLSHVRYETDDPDGCYVEYTLVELEAGRTPEGIRVLFDAYERSQKASVRQTLVASVRRAFCTTIKPVWSDSEVMTECKWVVEHQLGNMKVNREWRLAYSPGFFDVGNVKPPPLFIPRDGPDEVKATIIPVGGS